MAQFQLGRKDQARALLSDLRQLMKKPVWSRTVEEQRFLHEASELIEGNR